MANAAYVPGEHLDLRPLEPEDAPLLKQYLNDPAIARTLSMWRPMTLAGETEFIQNAAASPTQVVLGIMLRTDGRLIGVAGLHAIDWRDRNAIFGIFIGDESRWGKGYGSEATRLMASLAFERMGLNRLWLQVYADNAAGIRAYEKCGYQREGVLRRHVFRAGRWQDSVIMGLLAEEWLAAKP